MIISWFSFVATFTSGHFFHKVGARARLQSQRSSTKPAGWENVVSALYKTYNADSMPKSSDCTGEFENPYGEPGLEHKRLPFARAITQE